MMTRTILKGSGYGLLIGLFLLVNAALAQEQADFDTWLNWNQLPLEVQDRWVRLQTEPGWRFVGFQDKIYMGGIPVIEFRYRNLLTDEKAIVQSTLSDRDLNIYHARLMMMIWQEDRGQFKQWLNLNHILKYFFFP